MGLPGDTLKFLRLSVRDGPRTAVRLALNDLTRRLLRLTGHEHELTELRGHVARQADSIRRLAALVNVGKPPPPDASCDPRLSVILPAHGRVQTLNRAIDSVLVQTGARFELIVVDDGSPQALCAGQVPGLEHPSVRLLRQPRGGPCVARNHAIAHSDADVIVYLDSDNTMFPGYLQAVARAYAEAPDAMCAHAALLWDDDDTDVHLRHDDFDWMSLLSREVNVDMNCFSHRRSVWARLGGFDETLTRHGDLDLVLRYTRDHAPLRIPAVAARYYHGHAFARVSATQPSRPNAVRILAKHAPPAATGLRVLIYCQDYPQLSETYIDSEIAWLTRQGAQVEVHACESPGAPGRPQVPVHHGELGRTLDAVRPHIVHLHWLPLAAGVVGEAAKRGIPVTVRGHGFEFTADNYQACAAHEAVRSIYLFPHFLPGLPDPLAKARPVTSCFDSTRFYPRLTRDPRLVLRTAACLETKDIDLFFHAAARCPQYRFVLALARITRRPELPARFRDLNASLGHPVDLRFDVQHDEMTELVARAGVYLHTFGFVQAFGMPVSIMEAMACGAATLVPACPEARAYSGPQAQYYTSLDDVVSRLHDMLTWSTGDWQACAKASAEAAYTAYADEQVMPAIVQEWRRITAYHPPLPVPATRVAQPCEHNAATQ